MFSYEYSQPFPACTAYTRYVLDIGQSQDWLALQMSMAPCLLGYGAVAKMLHSHERTDKTDANTYWPWITNYVADDYVEAVRLGSGKSPPFSPLRSAALFSDALPGGSLLRNVVAQEEA